MQNEIMKAVFALMMLCVGMTAQAQTIHVDHKFWDGYSLYTVKEVRMGKYVYMTTSQDNELTLEKVDGKWRFSFDTSNMIGQLTARLTMYMNDPDCPDDVRAEVDEQLIGFVATTPCTRLHQCPKCGGQHDVTYEYING